MKNYAEDRLYLDWDVEAPPDILARLKELGSTQGYVTNGDILRMYPPAKQEADVLDQMVTAIQEAGILFLEDTGFEGAYKQGKAEAMHPEGTASQAEDAAEAVLPEIGPENLVGMYLWESARGPLLTHEEEVALAMRIERGLQAREEISDLKRVSTERHAELTRLIDDSWIATDHLITANSRLVVSIAKKYMNRGLPFLDLIQEGNIGLMRAAKRFDYKLGYKFSTYATWWIRQAVTRALSDQSRTIRLPCHLTDQISRMYRVMHQLKQQLGREPGEEEIAAALEVSSARVRQLLKDARYPLSLDMPTSFEDDSVLGDFLEDDEAPDPDEMAALSSLRQNLDQILGLLPPREVQILKLRYGLANGEAHTLREVGLKIGVSRERIRQIEAQAMRRLRQPEIQHKLRSYRSQPQI